MLSKGYEAVELYKCGYSHTEIQAGEEAFSGASTSTTDYICDLLKDNLKLDGSKMKDHDREKHCGSATGLAVAVVIVLLIFGAAGFMYYRKTKADAAGADRTTSIGTQLARARNDGGRTRRTARQPRPHNSYAGGDDEQGAVVIELDSMGAHGGSGDGPPELKPRTARALSTTHEVGLVSLELLNGQQKPSGLMDVAALDLEAYADLGTNHAGLSDLPPKIAANLKAFNRYKNILPNTHTRVNLEQIGKDSTTTFINANFVANARNNPKAYIAAQGPKPETVIAFWRMIWQENVRAIVMVTGLMEGTKQKCARYWPAELYNQDIDAGAVRYGGVEVRVLTGTKADGYKTATLEVICNGESRQCKHFWFDTWPDYGVPDDPAVVPRMLKDVRSFSSSVEEPWIVHCSAGIGRTGTFIGIDIGMDVLEASRKVSTVALVEYMRRDRGGMVQTPDQCDFINEALIEYAAGRNENIELEESDGFNEVAEVLYGNVRVVRGTTTSSPGGGDDDDAGSIDYGGVMSVPDRKAAVNPAYDDEFVQEESFYENVEI